MLPRFPIALLAVTASIASVACRASGSYGGWAAGVLLDNPPGLAYKTWSNTRQHPALKDPTQIAILLSIKELEEEDARPYIKAARVLERSIQRCGLLTSKRKVTLYTEVDPPEDEVIDRFYEALIDLVHQTGTDKQLVVGVGNLGSADRSDVPANPLFTQCGLTALGRERVSEFQRKG